MNEVLRARLRREIDDIMARYRAAGYFPSACVRVFNSRETLACACAGEAEENSLFDVASLTKIATATQIFLLIGQEKLGLRDKLPDALPALRNDAYLAERLKYVTLYHLLTHTSSLAAWYPFYSRRGEDFYAVLKYALLHTEPTIGMVYSDLNFMLLGKIIEHVQGKPLEVCLQEDLVRPLGLGNMTYLPDQSLPIVPSCYGNPIETRMCAERGISFDGFRPAGRPVRGEANDGNCHYYFRGVSGHAGIFADAAAYERLCQYYMNTADPLLIEAQREQPDAPGRGIGFQTGTSYPHGCGHTGFTGTGIYFSRDCDVGVISFTNRLFYPSENENATWEFRRALHEAAFALTGRFS
ncbi:MAG: serine hydrolase [Clostridia bacterium]|nr:serine hydrolase [Clostridia bacterium]